MQGTAGTAGVPGDSLSTGSFYYQGEFEPIVAQGRLHVRTAFSRDPVEAVFEPNGKEGRFGFEPSETRYIGDEILRPENAEVLWEMLRSKEDGGAGGYFYVCGRTGFATSVMDALEELVARYQDGSDEEKNRAADAVLYKLVGESDTCRTSSPPTPGRTWSAPRRILLLRSFCTATRTTATGWSSMVNLRHEQVGHLHPRRVQDNPGLLRHGPRWRIRRSFIMNPEVDSMLGMVRDRSRASPALRNGVGSRHWARRTRSMPLADQYRAWIELLYTMVDGEMRFNTTTP